MLILREPFASMWRGKDAFEEVEKITGDVARALESRRTLRFEVDGKGYYLKLHHGISLKEVFKSLIRLRLPVLGADREWLACERLKAHGVGVMTPVAFGQKGLNPLRRTSFIITEEIAPSTALAWYCEQWRTTPPDFDVKQRILRRVASMVREMHACGINHRDCYLVHFLMNLPFDGSEESLKLSLIDLHRAQLRDTPPPTRWRDKDLIGLYYSSMTCGIRRTDRARFLKIYFNTPELTVKEIIARNPTIRGYRKEAMRIWDRTRVRGRVR